MSTIIPKADAYWENGFNVMMIGMHGVGKTISILDFVREKNITLRYYSCSTLDPFTDLVGVPVPRHFCPECRIHYGNIAGTLDNPRCPRGECGAQMKETLKMIRPLEIDEAELLFFDEFNRADPKVHNAIFEVIQFKSINGEALPKVRCVWAAMNPPGDDYQVEELDPALVDRFQIYLDIKAKPSVAYMSQELPKPIAQALFTWWQAADQQRRGIENFISPRKLLDIGKVYLATGDLKAAVPTWMKVDRQKLADMLTKAQNEMKGKAEAKRTSGKLGDGPNPAFKYDDESLKANCRTVAKYMSDNQDDLDTHQAVLDTLESKQGRTWVRDYAELMEAMKPAMRESYIAKLNPGKYDTMREHLESLKDQNPARYERLPNWRKAVGLD